MNDRYLFDKHGSDAETERLEGLLAAYRINPVVPALGRVNREAVARPALSFFRPAFSFAAVIVFFAVFAASLTLLSSFLEQDAATDLTAVSPAVVSPPDIRRDEFPDAVSEFTVGYPDREVRRIEQSGTNFLKASVHTRRTKKLKGTTASRMVRLTKEERYAYEQVLAALYITGSKLKVLHDSLNSIDDDNKASLSR